MKAVNRTFFRPFQNAFLVKGLEERVSVDSKSICRHCNFDSLEDEVFPSVGVEIKFEGHNRDDSLPALLSGLALPSSSTSGSVTVMLNGKQD